MKYRTQQRRRRNRFSRGEAVTKIGYSESILVTEVECGQKRLDYYAVTGFFLHLRYRRSSSVFFIAHTQGNEKSTFSPGEGMAAFGGK